MRLYTYCKEKGGSMLVGVGNAEGNAVKSIGELGLAYTSMNDLIDHATEAEWEGWYNDAKALSGIDLSFDDEGNAITD